MNFRSDKKSRALLTLEVTPLVDIVFLLLIFFLLTATYTRNPNIDINLPKASSKSVQNQAKDVLVAIRQNGEILYDNRVLSIDDLEGVFSARYADDKDLVVVVRADKGAKHGRVVEVMDLAKKVGFSKLAIAIQNKPPE